MKEKIECQTIENRMIMEKSKIKKKFDMNIKMEMKMETQSETSLK